MTNLSKFTKLMEKMAIGEFITIPGRGGWKIKSTKTKEGFDTELFNPTSDGKGKRWFSINTKDNPYGAPIVIQEPTLGILCKDVGVDIEDTVVGALVIGNSGKIEERFSWSNIVFMKKLKFSITKKGELIINGKSKGFLSLLFLPDKNRMKGYVGVFTSKKPEKVKILEMEDLLLRQLRQL